MSDDLIKRSDAIKAIINKPAWHGSDGSYYHGDDIRDALNGLPSADRPQEWIPCSERLPEKAGHYLCSFKKANRIDSIYVDLAYWTGGRWYGYLANEINAWMPLPKPWKGADDYERAIEQMEHDMLYEPTYNPEDGSM